MHVVVQLRIPAEPGCTVEKNGEPVGTVVGCRPRKGGGFLVTLDMPDDLAAEMVSQTPYCIWGAKESGDAE